MKAGGGRTGPLPQEGADLVGVARSRAATRPGQRAYLFLRDGEVDGAHGELDYAGLDERARRVAAALAEELPEPRGARVLLLHPPGLEPVSDFLGCLYAGAVAVPTAPPRPNRAMERTQALTVDSGATAVLTVESVLADRERLVACAPALGRLRWIATDALPEGSESAWREYRPRPEDLAFLQYTSGSTGTPKGVAVSHANLAHNEALLQLAFRNTPDSTLVSWLPLHHDMGLIGMVLQALWVGAPCVLMAPPHFLARPARWLEAITRHRATMSCAPNFAYDLCAERVAPDDLAGLDLSSWTMAVNGAEPVRLATLERFARAFAPCGFRREALHPGFGLAEGTLIVSLGLEPRAPLHRWVDAERLAQGNVVTLDAGAPGAKPLVGCGATMPGQEIAIVDPESRLRRAPGEVGEIWVRGPSVALGYWSREEESARTFRARLAPDGEGPFLRTGDLGFLADGELYVTGRRKDLVIVHGQNHYPQDLELAAERSHPDLRSSGAAAFGVELHGREQLVVVAEVERRARARADEILRAVRAALVEACEVEPAALVLIRPGSLPRTSSGKVRRRATREAWLAGELARVAEWHAATGDAAPLPAPTERTPQALESWLTELAARELGVPPATVDPTAPLAALGLDSLRAVRLSHRIELAFGTSVPLARLYDGSSLQHLALEALRAPAQGTPAPPPPPAAPALSHGQRSLWFLHRLAPTGTAYHLTAALRVLGALDADALERALAALVGRHAALRTVVVADAGGEPRADVRSSLPPSFERVDATGADDDELRSRVAQRLGRPYDLERGPLLRALLLERDDAPDVLALGAHHVALDHWSLGIVLADLGRLYADARAGRESSLPAATSSADHARAQRAWLAGPQGEEAWRFWSNELADPPPVAELPADRRRPGRPRHRGRTLHRTLAPELAARLERFARDRGTTAYVVALAAFEAFLARATGEQRFLYGTLTAGRSRAADADVVGYLVNPLVQRADVAGAPTFEELVARVRARAARCFAHADLPFGVLVERLQPARDASRPPLFQTLFVWQHAHAGAETDFGALALGRGGARARLADVPLESLELESGASQYDLSLSAATVGSGPDRRLALALEFDTDLFEPATAELLLERYTRILGAALEHPGRRAADLPTDERPDPSAEWDGPELGLGAGGSIHARLAEHARQRPAAVAVAQDGRSVTYGELRTRVDRLARRLAGLGAGVESVVAVHAGRGLERCVALLAADAVGAAWMPLDPALSEERRRFLVRDAGAALVVATRELAGRVPRPDLVLDESDPCPSGPALAPLPALDEAAAYVLHTSGSTGRPKGVVVPRRALLAHALSAIEHFGLREGDAVLHLAAVGFDLSVEELFPFWLAGARVVVRAEPRAPSFEELEELVEREGITVLDLPTAYWHAWTSSLAARGTAPPAGLRLLIVGGERASAGAFATWCALPGRPPSWVNTYGPTEATVTATRFDPGRSALDPRSEIPIGRAVPGWRVGVRSRSGAVAPTLEPGELAIGGAGVARGYLGDPRRTAERFVPDPGGAPGGRVYLSGDRARRRADGELEFLGRLDEQVKISGFRVEPAEVEAELHREADVREAVVVAREAPDGATRLVAYAVTSADADALRQRLAERLPAQLVPAQVVRVDALPRTATGKVDRRALPAPAPRQGASARAPSAGAEATLARLWEELLGVTTVGRDDDFFALGGDSIRSIQLASRATRAGLPLSAQDVFQHPRLADLARVARSARAGADAPVRGPVPLTPIQRWFFEQELERPEHWNQHVVLALEPTSAGAVAAALEHLVERHDALRLRFARVDGEWRAEVGATAGAFRFESIDLGALPPPEHETAFRRAEGRAQAGLDLERGPLLRAVLFDGATDGTVRLLLVAHHLVVDAVSWRVLADELGQQLAGGAGTRQLAPTPWSTWARWIDARARSARADALGAGATPGLPGRRPAGRQADEEVLQLVLEPALTTRFERAARGGGASEEELLVTALAAAVAEESARSQVWLELEGHGRAVAGSPDVGATVGWFTELLPVCIDLADAADAAARLEAVGRELRAARPRARERSWARHAGSPSPEISFDYLGRFDGAFGQRGVRLLAAGRDRAPSARRSHWLEIDARLERGALHVDWSHPAGDRPRVERLATAFRSHLRDLVEACEAGARAAFGLAELDGRQLANVLEQLDLEAPSSGGKA